MDSIQRCPHQMKRDSDINLIQNNLNLSCATDFLNLSYDSLFCFLVALLHIPSTAQREKQPYSVPAKSLYLWVYLGTIADLLFFSHLLRIAFMNVYCTCCVIQLHHISEKTILPFTSNSTPAFHAQNVCGHPNCISCDCYLPHNRCSLLALDISLLIIYLYPSSSHPLSAHTQISSLAFLFSFLLHHLQYPCLTY